MACEGYRRKSVGEACSCSSKIQLPAGKATPAPPVGTALGPHGIAIMEFCKAYNERTAAQAGQIIPVAITVYEDRSLRSS